MTKFGIEFAVGVDPKGQIWVEGIARLNTEEALLLCVPVESREEGIKIADALDGATQAFMELMHQVQERLGDGSMNTTVVEAHETAKDGEFLDREKVRGALPVISPGQKE